MQTGKGLCPHRVIGRLSLRRITPLLSFILSVVLIAMNLWCYSDSEESGPLQQRLRILTVRDIALHRLVQSSYVRKYHSFVVAYERPQLYVSV